MSAALQHIIVALILACVCVLVVIRLIRFIKSPSEASSCNCAHCDVSECALRNVTQKKMQEGCKKSDKNIANYDK